MGAALQRSDGDVAGGDRPGVSLRWGGDSGGTEGGTLWGRWGDARETGWGGSGGLGVALGDEGGELCGDWGRQ